MCQIEIINLIHIFFFLKYDDIKLKYIVCTLCNLWLKILNYIQKFEAFGNRKIIDESRYCDSAKNDELVYTCKRPGFSCIRNSVFVTLGVSRIRNEFWVTMEINSSVLQQHGAVLI